MKKIFFIIFYLLITNANSLERSKEEIKNGVFLEDITALGNINDKDNDTHNYCFNNSNFTYFGYWGNGIVCC